MTERDPNCLLSVGMENMPGTDALGMLSRPSGRPVIK